VRLKTYYYPGWVARLDGEPVPLSSDELGAQLISVPPGRHTVETRFVSTPPRTFAAVLTTLGSLTVFGLALSGYARRGKESVILRPAPAQEGYTAMAVGSPQPSASGNAEAPPTAKARLKKSLPVKLLGPVAIGLLVLVIGLIVVLSLRRAGGPASIDGGQTGPTSAPRSSSKAVGSEVRLKVAELASVFVAVDTKALDEMIRAFSLKDNSKVENMVESGRVISIDNDTRARILEVNSGRIKARILEGPNAMVDVWVPERWVQ
jgi:hypothetical protein